MSAFENFGPPQAARPGDKMECGVCWHVYDPAEGDLVWQVAPDTAFPDLPEELALPELRRAAGQVPAARRLMAEDDSAADVGRRIAARYRAIAEGPMAGLPVCNPALRVADVGFRAHHGRAVGIVVSPWFMNVVAAALPDAAPAPRLRRARPSRSRCRAASWR